MRISSREFAEWMAYWSLEPFGDEWLRTASIIATLANINRDAKARQEPFRAEEFMPTLTPALSQREREKSGEGDWRETKRRFMALVKKTPAPTPVIDRPPRESAGEGR